MQKKDIDWSKLGFGYTPTDYRFEAHWKDGKWDEGKTAAVYAVLYESVPPKTAIDALFERSLKEEFV